MRRRDFLKTLGLACGAVMSCGSAIVSIAPTAACEPSESFASMSQYGRAVKDLLFHEFVKQMSQGGPVREVTIGLREFDAILAYMDDCSAIWGNHSPNKNPFRYEPRPREYWLYGVRVEWSECGLNANAERGIAFTALMVSKSRTNIRGSVSWFRYFTKEEVLNV